MPTKLALARLSEILLILATILGYLGAVLAYFLGSPYVAWEAFVCAFVAFQSQLFLIYHRLQSQLSFLRYRLGRMEGMLERRGELRVG